MDRGDFEDVDSAEGDSEFSSDSSDDDEDFEPNENENENDTDTENESETSDIDEELSHEELPAAYISKDKKIQYSDQPIDVNRRIAHRRPVNIISGIFPYYFSTVCMKIHFVELNLLRSKNIRLLAY